MSGKDYAEKVRKERSLLERIMGYIPGYRGYKEKELRRESDRLVRMETVNRLKTAKTTFRRSFANPMLVQKLSGEDTYRFEALTSRFDRVTQRIDRAVAGYAGMFDAIKVKEDKLDTVIKHDLDLIEKAESIKADVEKAVSIEPATDDWRTAMDTLISKIEELDKLVDERSSLLRGLEA
jgi:soluble cytochrome b562